MAKACTRLCHQWSIGVRWISVKFGTINMIQFIPKISLFLSCRSQHLTLQQFSPISVHNVLKYPLNSQTVKTVGFSYRDPKHDRLHIKKLLAPACLIGSIGPETFRTTLWAIPRWRTRTNKYTTVTYTQSHARLYNGINSLVYLHISVSC